MNSLEEAPKKRERCRVQQLFDLCDGPTGPTSVGRVMDGPNSRRLVLLRRIGRADVTGIELALGVVENLAHPSVAKVVALATDADTVFVASEHIDGVSLHELVLVAERSKTPVSPRVATRIIHDALIAADEVDTLLGWKVSPRCVFADTIWIAEYGATLLSEPGVADYIHRRGGHTSRIPVGVELPRGPAALLDARAALDLLMQLVSVGHGKERAADVPREILVLTESSRVWESRRALAGALAALPAELFGNEEDVAEVVNSLAGTTLEMRRYQVMPLGAIRDAGGNEDQTACFSGALPELARPPQPQSSDAATSFETRQGEGGTSDASGTGVSPITANANLGPSDDDEAATTVFRPSRIPMLGRVTRQHDDVTSSAIHLRASSARMVDERASAQLDAESTSTAEQVHDDRDSSSALEFDLRSKRMVRAALWISLVFGLVAAVVSLTW